MATAEWPRPQQGSILYLNLHSLPRYASFSHLLPLYPSQCGSITRHVNADRNGLPALALPLYASSRCHFMLQGTSAAAAASAAQRRYDFNDKLSSEIGH
jgi:hypothetical protein